MGSRVDRSSRQLLDDLDRFLIEVLTDANQERIFYATSTPEGIVRLARTRGFQIDADDFLSLIRTDVGECWVFGGNTMNPIAHLLQVFGV